MFSRRLQSGAVGLVLFAVIAIGAGQKAALAAGSGIEAFAQAAKPSAGTQAATWTREKLAAAKKRWAENKEKFSDCSKQLGNQQKEKRLSMHDQGHFLQNCMSKKP